MFESIFSKHTLVLASYTTDELLDVAERKFPDRLSVIDKTLARMPNELIYTPHEIEEGLFEIRDPDDYPILYTAVKEDVDILISNGNDFLAVEIDKPEILTSAQYLGKYK
ncbi:MAG: PIN domain nuclease [Clostridiales Family XIII bacterium]|jgi:predicted nucleic acid-binding protein|nr:PIN domain nuclease [Clostridiales Family XIII bacterium]